MATVEVSRFMHAPRRIVHAVLSDIDAHHRLADDGIQLLDTNHQRARPRGLIRVNPPIPLSWTIRTEMICDEPDRVVGIAAIGEREAADLVWQLDQREGGTLVRLEATTRDLSSLEQLLLKLGGRWWLRRRFSSTLRRLERLVRERALDQRVD
jgi:hypothetical protein